MNAAEMYHKAVTKPVEQTPEEKETKNLIEQKRSEANLARQAWLTLPYTQRFLSELRKRELDLMIAARASVSNHGITDTAQRNLVRSSQIREIIEYATTIDYATES